MKKVEMLLTGEDMIIDLGESNRVEKITLSEVETQNGKVEKIVFEFEDETEDDAEESLDEINGEVI